MLSLQRYLLGETEEMLDRRRDEIFATGPDDYKSLGEVLGRVATEGNVVVMGSESAIAAANTERQGLFKVSKVL
jgi:hypothetical protein